MIRRTWTNPTHAAAPVLALFAMGAGMGLTVMGAMELLLRAAS